MEIGNINICGDDGICFKMSRYLHRYYSIDENLKDSLRENYLWFSDPLKFNDPYDCNLSSNTSDTTYPELYEHLKKAFDKDNRGKSIKFFEDRIKYLSNNPSEMNHLGEMFNKEAVDKIGICCFSENDKALLMWSHYANKHKGICLTFDVSKDEELFTKHPYKVEYPQKYPVYHWPRDTGKVKPFRYLIATKSKEWDYEEEIRIVRNSDSVKQEFRGKVSFNKKALVAIKFGYNSDESEQIIIKSILDKVGGYGHVKFYKAKLKRFEFGIEYEEIII
jgi:hypothetical protein